ncbi:putative CRE-binding bZIP protein [Clavispora lusitaniae]|uniref:CRE-binding bZIP protein n=1 Tax=Clavispora lusitaniae TaxID=36911 RepID=A0AA91T2T4_CLALS|nr:putative CRE-binding bZIP protein [Clavispora lusitaniae]
MTSTNLQSKTSFDLELNPFESSFASKDLLAQERSVDYNGTGSASSSTNHGSTASTDKTPASSTPEQKKEEQSATAGTNKHQLRISNLQPPGERLPGLTPPLFTPGGRRLPPIHLSPNAPLGSPGTPGAIWNSLVSAGNGTDQGNYAQFINMMRKSGLTPNESNLRSGLTPGVGSHGFNFNVGTPGQMTPGLQSLLGLANGTDSFAMPPPVVPSAETSADTTVDSAKRAPDGAGKEPPAGPESAPDSTASAASATSIASATSAASATEGRTASVVSSGSTASGGAASGGSGSTVAADGNKNVERPNGTARGKAVEVKNEAEEAPRKRARRTRKTERSSSQTGEEAKRKQFLERNRVAASKCRQRKKQLFSKMESELAFYSSGYRELSAQVTQLRDSLLSLRGLVLAHKDCPGLVSTVGGYQQLQTLIGQTDYVAQAAAEAHPNFTSIPSTIPTTLNAKGESGQDTRVQGMHNGSIVQANQAMSNQALQNQALQNQALQNQAISNQALQNQSIQNQSIQNQPMSNVTIPNQSINQSLQNQQMSNQPVQNMSNSVSNQMSNLSNQMSNLSNLSNLSSQAISSSSVPSNQSLQSSQGPVQSTHAPSMASGQGRLTYDMEIGALPRNYSLGELNSIDSDGQRRVISNTELAKSGNSNYGLRSVASMADLQGHSTGLNKHFEL